MLRARLAAADPGDRGGAIDHRDLVLESADGNRFAAFAALPEEPSGQGVVVLPDVRGLYRFYEALALRFAERGIELATELEAPILALQAGDDQHITAEHNAEFDEALSKAGVEHEIVTYPGAPRSFFDRRHEDFANTSADAWDRVLSFIERYG